MAKKLIPLAIFAALLLALNFISNSRGSAAKDERVFTSKTLDAASRKSGVQNSKNGADRKISSSQNPASGAGAKDESGEKGAYSTNIDGARSADGGTGRGADLGDLKSHPQANEPAEANSKDEADIHRRSSADYEASNSQNPAENSKNQLADEPCISRECVSAHIRRTGSLPQNFITKKQAGELGWQGGDLWRYARGKSIGGDRFGNFERRLPDKKGRIWRECDIEYRGGPRSAKRLIFSNDGLIFYTADHYESFERVQ
ncbi:ribonuclease domain-containing protein [uncultured Campylobacter sp.]|uniref:ribonuclease domain-containing protein n=1 Tax=uncultured Campylobacter sp. TaxID=218934 RepID=UPI00260F7599|nr:ribonuclease domain-containing protein [uncultured Campylobacter sp.]